MMLIVAHVSPSLFFFRVVSEQARIEEARLTSEKSLRKAQASLEYRVTELENQLVD